VTTVEPALLHYCPVSAVTCQLTSTCSALFEFPIRSHADSVIFVQPMIARYI